VNEKVIDIRKEFKESDSPFFRSLPRFIVKAVEKIICQDGINDTINRSSDKTGAPFVKDVLKGWNIEVKVSGGEKIPAEGRFIFASNHPVGGIDALAFFSMIYDHFPVVISPVNSLLSRIPNLEPLILAINAFGKNSRETVVMLEELFESDAQIMIFPAGEVSRKKKGIISDKAWQKTFITKAVQHNRDIIPVHISGRNSALFYAVANMREALGIKMFLESLLLPGEMMNQRNSSITLTIGDVIRWQTFTSQKSPMEWAQAVRNIVYSLPGTKQI
jgi:1-acyl-sn-glycerol-3-phosphate acyltransferase